MVETTASVSVSVVPTTSSAMLLAAATALTVKKVEPKPTLVRPKDSGLKIPVSEIDPSLLVFASKSKPRPAKQTVSVSFHL